MDNKQKYRELCKTEPRIPIFSKDWWLDAVCEGNSWDVTLVEKGGAIVASFPYMLIKHYGFTEIAMPPLTQTMGPWIKYPDGQKYTRKLEYEKEIFTVLIQQIPKVAAFQQNFSPLVTNWLPFYWQGFSQTTRYTYVINDLTDFNEILAEFSHAKRQSLKKAGKSNLSVKFDLSAEQFYKNHSMTLGKQNRKISYTYTLFQAIYKAAYAHENGRTIYAVDEQGKIHAALFVIWDSFSAYDLISTIDPDYRSSGAATLLVYEIMKYVSLKTKHFDFEGSMIEGVENSFRQFGTTQTPYFHVSKQYSRLFKTLWHGRAFAKAIIGRD